VTIRGMAADAFYLVVTVSVGILAESESGMTSIGRERSCWNGMNTDDRIDERRYGRELN
jgi:hypothetical protein